MEFYKEQFHSIPFKSIPFHSNPFYSMFYLMPVKVAGNKNMSLQASVNFDFRPDQIGHFGVIFCNREHVVPIIETSFLSDHRLSCT